MRQKVGIVGFRGYGGAELVSILARHPGVERVLLEHRSDAAETPGPGERLRRVLCTPEAFRAEGFAAAFLATPADVSMELAPWMLEAGAKVIDLSGAFRLRTPERYRRWYKEEHTQPALLAEAVFGLPEMYREQLRTARLIANPGCYPTGAMLAIAPLTECGVADRAAGIVCDAKSGVSGAGRKPSLKTHFCEVAENLSAYSILEHRHVPEILLNCGLEEGELSFTAQLLPITRGILETVYFRTKLASVQELRAVYEKRYANEPFVRIWEPPHVPDLHAVTRTNFCDIGMRLDAATGRAVVVTAFDNLVKGAAGQAIQNMNLALGFEETEALL